MQEFGKNKHMVHSGMFASAEWLRDRLYCVAQVTLLATSPPIDIHAIALSASFDNILSLWTADKGNCEIDPDPQLCVGVLQGLHEAGFEIVIVGHSLGAGAASLLALIFKSM